MKKYSTLSVCVCTVSIGMVGCNPDPNGSGFAPSESNLGEIPKGVFGTQTELVNNTDEYQKWELEDVEGENAYIKTCPLNCSIPLKPGESVTINVEVIVKGPGPFEAYCRARNDGQSSAFRVFGVYDPQ